MRVVVLADTHLKRQWPNRRLPNAALALLETADVILHAGDITQQQHLDELAHHAPVHAVLGNNDTELVGTLPETLTLDLAGVRIGMVHDSGPARGRGRRLHALFPDADVVVFGHSHIPWNATNDAGQLLFNPGSPTERRRQPHRTVGLLEIADGELIEARVVVVDGARDGSRSVDAPNASP